MKLSYGDGITCNLLTGDVTRVGPNRVESIPDEAIATAVRDAFSAPLDYPNLASATVPGDRVAIAMGYGTPRLPQVLSGVMAALGDAGIDESATSIVLSADFDEGVAATLREIVGPAVTITTHATECEEHLALLGVTEANRPLRLNRVLCEADLVIPVGPVHGNDATAGTLFPRFSDVEAQQRFNSPTSYETEISRRRLSAEVRECNWLLGVGLALAIVPGPGGSVAAVLCGTPDGVTTAGRRSYHDIWSASVPHRAELVVATIVGDASQQSWSNLSKAIAAADELLVPGGAIAICSELAVRPGASGRRLRDAADLADVERKILHDEYSDSVASLLLCRSLQRSTVYLKSRLPSAVVERFGLAPIETDHEVERLVKTYHRCLILEEAQYLEPELAH